MSTVEFTGPICECGDSKGGARKPPGGSSSHPERCDVPSTGDQDHQPEMIIDIRVSELALMTWIP